MWRTLGKLKGNGQNKFEWDGYFGVSENVFALLEINICANGKKLNIESYVWFSVQ